METALLSGDQAYFAVVENDFPDLGNDCRGGTRVVQRLIDCVPPLHALADKGTAALRGDFEEATDLRRQAHSPRPPEEKAAREWSRRR